VTGDVIESVWVGSKPEPLKSTAVQIVAALEFRRILGVRRVGKHIVFDLERALAGGKKCSVKSRVAKKQSPRKAERKSSMSSNAQPTAQWIVHLGMSGSMVVCKPDSEIAKHTHLIAKLASGRELRFVDPRRFGRLSVAEGFEAGGFEPLEIQFGQFADLFRGRKTPIKSALLNQKLLRGVGNIYADESLFRAGIRPRRRAASLTRHDQKRLYHAVQAVLREAIALGGSSVSDYVDAAGEKGFFQLQHRVYGREGERCLVCKSPIKRIVIGGRSSHYCPRCQK
jgi:formamidopyrimidine-DNA glycosylase